MDVPEVEDADAALTWEALESVGGEHHDRPSDAPGGDAPPRGLPAAPHEEHEARAAAEVAVGDQDAFAPLDALPSFAARPARAKRKVFSKHLQCLCLERYAVHARTHGRLPDRAACELLLLEGFAQFVREGGSAAHPRLAHAEFLKLVRNRSAERKRKQREKPATDSADGEGVCRKKRKQADEYEAKIDDLIEEIDRVRRPVAVDEGENSPAGVVDTILRLQGDTQRLQRELQERLARLQDQCEQQEPSSVSV